MISKRIFIALSISGLVVLGFSGATLAKDDKNPYEPLTKPGPVHKLFKAKLGTWDVVQKVWKQPGQAPEIARGVATRTLKFGGRFLEEVSKLTDAKGQKITTMILHGYNNWSREFETIVYSDFDTAIYTYKGKIDKKTGHLVLIGSWSMYIKDKRMDVGVRSVVKFSPDKEVMTLYFKYPNFPESKAGEITSTRRKAKPKSDQKK